MLNLDLLTRLAEADRRHQRELGIGLLLRLVLWILGLLVIIGGLDVLLHLDSQSRVLIDCAVVALALAVLGIFVYFAKFRCGSPEQIARLLETRNPAFGSKLINWLQLRAQTQNGAESTTTELARQAVETYSAQLEQADFSA